MALQHDQAIARVTVDGLGVCCFNSAEKKWDIAFLRDVEPDCHQLVLQIEEGPTLLINENERLISFETVKGHFPAEFASGYFDNGPINDRRRRPSAGPETENFRWVIDLERDVAHDFVGLKRNPPTRLTRAFIHDAVCYTLNVSHDNLVLVHNDQDPTGMPNPPVFGRTNDEISADMFCDADGEVFITIDREEIWRKPLRPGNPWKICLTNLCVNLHYPSGLHKGDFQNFYKVIDIRGVPHALWGPGGVVAASSCTPPRHFNRVTALGPDSALGRPDCDTTRLGTIQSLDPLFS